jgi:hypothetical protein
MRYKIKMSDADMLAFSNYLVEHHPEYPSWSTRTSAKDYSRINEAGNPAQVLIMNEPRRYYEAYQAFKAGAKVSGNAPTNHFF